MHERGWLGVSDSEDEQPFCASAAHKQGWAAVDELGDLSMDDTGWQDVALQEDGAVSNEEDGLVQAAAVARERSEWSKSRLLILNRVRSAARIPSEACFQQWPPSELLVLDASPDFVQRSAVEDAETSGEASSEGGETVDPVAERNNHSSVLRN